MNSNTPGWLLEKQEPFHQDMRLDKLNKSSFTEKTIKSIARVMRDEFHAGQIAAKPGLLQRFDPRVKLFTTLLLIIAACLLRHPLALLAFNLWILWMAIVSQVPAGTFIKRVWIIVPIFTGVIVFPSIFSFISPGEPLLTLFYPENWRQPLAITKPGVHHAAVLILRAGATVALAYLLTLTTYWNRLLKGLGALLVPSIFLSVLEMTYRYIFLLLHTATEIFTARQSRNVGVNTAKEQRRFIAAALGSLWGKAYAISDETHAAMLSRGYTGKPITLHTFHMKIRDWLWILFIILVILFFLGGDRILAG